MKINKRCKQSLSSNFTDWRVRKKSLSFVFNCNVFVNTKPRIYKSHCPWVVYE